MFNTPTNVDDYELIRRYRAGDERAFSELVRRYQRQVANLIYLTMGSRDGVEDLAQDAFIRVHRALDKFNFESSFFSWLYRITLNLCIDEIRRRKIRRVLSLDFLTEGGDPAVLQHVSHPGPDVDLLKRERKESVVQALQRISPLHREILILREYQDLGYEEIADALGISLQAVKSRLFRARAELREELKDYMRGDQ